MTRSQDLDRSSSALRGTLRFRTESSAIHPAIAQGEPAPARGHRKASARIGGIDAHSLYATRPRAQGPDRNRSARGRRRGGRRRRGQPRHRPCIAPRPSPSTGSQELGTGAIGNARQSVADCARLPDMVSRRIWDSDLASMVRCIKAQGRNRATRSQRDCRRRCA
jgi:hypothetical protein